MHVKRLGRRSLAGWAIIPLLAVASLGAGERDPSVVAAVKHGDHAAVRMLLRQHPDVNAAEPDGTTALHWAVQQNDLETVDLLMAAGADVNVANRYGITPLSVACTNGNAAIVGKLLQARADPNTATPEGETPLMTAARTGQPETVKELLAHGANVNAAEQWRGQTALMWASAENNAAVARVLIDAGADIRARSNGGFTALLFGVRAGSADAVKVLVDAGANVNDAIQVAPRRPPAGRGAPGGPDPAGRPPAAAASAQQNQTAAERRQINQLLQVFNTGSRGRSGPGETSALVIAITNAHFELAAWLLDRGADPDASGQGWTALHQIAWTRRPPIQHGMPPAVQTGNMGSLELAERLLQYGADPDARVTKEPGDGARNVLDRIASTPFLNAAKLADIPYMRLLLEYGADPSIATEEGATPLMAAAGVGIWQVGESAATNEEAFEAVKLCYELGNDVNTVDANGDTALHGAAHRGANEIVKFLVEKGARLDVPNKIGWTPWIVADGVMYPNTYNRRLETAALLLKLGADPKAGKRRPEDVPPREEQQLKAATASSRP
jgi:ankyrin repeat protein